jgi:hypothetical protein
MELGTLFSISRIMFGSGEEAGVYMKIWSDAGTWRYVSMETGATWSGNTWEKRYFKRNKRVLEGELIITGEIS